MNTRYVLSDYENPRRYWGLALDGRPRVAALQDIGSGPQAISGVLVSRSYANGLPIAMFSNRSRLDYPLAPDYESDFNFLVGDDVFGDASEGLRLEISELGSKRRLRVFTKDGVKLDETYSPPKIREFLRKLVWGETLEHSHVDFALTLRDAVRLNRPSWLPS
jgi:hypothetical protein